MSEYFTLFAYIIGGSIISVSGMLLIRRSVAISTLESHHEVAGFIYAVIGVIYAVLIAFCVLVVWDQFKEAQERIENEASALGDVYRDSDCFQDSVKLKIRSLTFQYAESMIKNEFKEMQSDSTSQKTEMIYVQLWKCFYNYEPKGDKEKMWYTLSLTKLDELGKARRLRIMSLGFGVPDFMWIILIFGASLTIGFSYFFGTKNVYSQGLMVVSLTISIVLVLLLIKALDHPFSGIIHINPAPFELIRDKLLSN